MTTEKLNGLQQLNELALTDVEQVKMLEIFEKMNKNVNALEKNIERTDFIEKLKTAFPLAVMASMITLLGYGLINLINSLI